MFWYQIKYNYAPAMVFKMYTDAIKCGAQRIGRKLNFVLTINCFQYFFEQKYV